MSNYVVPTIHPTPLMVGTSEGQVAVDWVRSGQTRSHSLGALRTSTPQPPRPATTSRYPTPLPTTVCNLSHLTGSTVVNTRPSGSRRSVLIPCSGSDMCPAAPGARTATAAAGGGGGGGGGVSSGSGQPRAAVAAPGRHEPQCRRDPCPLTRHTHVVSSVGPHRASHTIPIRSESPGVTLRHLESPRITSNHLESPRITLKPPRIVSRPAGGGLRSRRSRRSAGSRLGHLPRPVKEALNEAPAR